MTCFPFFASWMQIPLRVYALVMVVDSLHGAAFALWLAPAWAAQGVGLTRTVTPSPNPNPNPNPSPNPSPNPNPSTSPSPNPNHNPNQARLQQRA